MGAPDRLALRLLISSLGDVRLDDRRETQNKRDGLRRHDRDVTLSLARVRTGGLDGRRRSAEANRGRAEARSCPARSVLTQPRELGVVSPEPRLFASAARGPMLSHAFRRLFYARSTVDMAGLPVSKVEKRRIIESS